MSCQNVQNKTTMQILDLQLLTQNYMKRIIQNHSSKAMTEMLALLCM